MPIRSKIQHCNAQKLIERVEQISAGLGEGETRRVSARMRHTGIREAALNCRNRNDMAHAVYALYGDTIATFSLPENKMLLRVPYLAAHHLVSHAPNFPLTDTQAAVAAGIMVGAARTGYAMALDGASMVLQLSPQNFEKVTYALLESVNGDLSQLHDPKNFCSIVLTQTQSELLKRITHIDEVAPGYKLQETILVTCSGYLGAVIDIMATHRHPAVGLIVGAVAGVALSDTVHRGVTGQNPFDRYIERHQLRDAFERLGMCDIAMKFVQGIEMSISR